MSAINSQQGVELQRFGTLSAISWRHGYLIRAREGGGKYAGN